MSRSVRDIRLFIAAYEERSFTAAAARENATQSGVSQHIRKLEETFGVNLFSREKGRVMPTPAGDSYYRRCLDVLRAHEAADRSVRTYATGLDGDIVIGLMPTMTRCALAPVLARFT
ncbi:MAG TPA: LysR family transcriptional regulator, partial [Beijerinckiaceae bacterium]|nr:LysR family transcriptional regulator [Beijerinckiaceae bacterium]